MTMPSLRATSRPHAAICARIARAIAVAALLSTCAMLAGCASLLGLGNSDKDGSTLYAPDPRITATTSWPTARWQLAVSPPTAARVVDTFRITVRPTPDEVQVYKGGVWAKRPSDMLEDTLTRALEDSGRIDAIARQGSGVAAEYKLVMDLRRFEADYDGGASPSATIEVNVKLLRTVDQSVVGSRTFLHAEPAAGTDVAAVVDAFSRSLTLTVGELAPWILQTGNAHQTDVNADNLQRR